MINYLMQSSMTYINKNTDFLQSINRTPLAIAKLCRNIIEHQNGLNRDKIKTNRYADLELRSASEILSEARRRSIEVTNDNVNFEKKIIGNCHTISILCLAILRELGIPSRYRHALCTYLDSNFFFDQSVIEYWCFNSNRWKILDASMNHDFLATRGISIDFPLDDIPKDKSIFYENVWKEYREGSFNLNKIDASLQKKINSFDKLVLITMQDFLALHKFELSQWDYFDISNYISNPHRVDLLINSIGDGLYIDDIMARKDFFGIERTIVSLNPYLRFVNA